MIPFGNKPVTLFHRQRGPDPDSRTVETWQRFHLTGCSWRQTAARLSGDSGSVHAYETVCRIPAEQQCPDVGDMLVPGHVQDMPATASEVSALTRRYPGAVRITAVGHYAQPGFPIPHWAARG